ncbi:MAG: riboflavin synthase [Bdellovibrionales bacterium]|nr:riboflavin synthase [Bdellovibrionales bacterium]
MFTGIIEKTGRVRAIEKTESQAMRIQVDADFSDVLTGESVAVNGVCLTTTQAGRLDFFVSLETLSKTALGNLKVGAKVNLERALLPTTRLSGHYVQGHVDGVGKFLRSKTFQTPNGVSRELWFSVPAELSRYLVSKGSIAINGISLTINEIDEAKNEFQVHIIPHTWENTQLSEIRDGDAVHLEVDVIAKYVEKMLRSRTHG